ncbi:MAG: hypothetical protein JJU13_12060 [Balneolaceae bacterium]|nr:hypothetical protein [Balneolaceae bacterium]
MRYLTMYQSGFGKHTSLFLLLILSLGCGVPDGSSDFEDELNGGSDYKGELLFAENFHNDDFASRGWYDVRSGAVLTTENPAPGTSQVLECRYGEGDQRCAEGYPLRIKFDETESLYLSYWVRYSNSWEGSGVGYHPHEFHFATNLDTDYVGPANSHLTMYIEQVNLIPKIALQDSRNVDDNCILRNDDSFEGCDGDFSSYPFTENRSVAACNGLEGTLDNRDCFWNGSYWYSSRSWDAAEPAITPGEWQFVEAYLRMNDIEDGIGLVNGSIRYWIDGELLISSDNILFRTGANPEMAFDKFIFAPWIGVGSPAEQTMWIGDITVAKGVIP